MTTFTVLKRRLATPGFDRQQYTVVLDRALTHSFENAVDRKQDKNTWSATSKDVERVYHQVAYVTERYLAPADMVVPADICLRWIGEQNSTSDTIAFIRHIAPVWSEAAFAIRYSRGLSADTGTLVFSRTEVGENNVTMMLDEARAVFEVLEIDPGLLLPTEAGPQLVGSAPADQVASLARAWETGVTVDPPIDTRGPGKQHEVERRLTVDRDLRQRAARPDALAGRVRRLWQLAAWATGRQSDALICWA